MDVIQPSATHNRKLFVMLVITLTAICILSEIMAYILKAPSLSQVAYTGTPVLLIAGMFSLLRRGYYHLYALIVTLIRAAFVFIALVLVRCLMLNRMGAPNVFEAGVSWLLALAMADAVFLTARAWLSAVWGSIKKHDDLAPVSYNSRQR